MSGPWHSGLILIALLVGCNAAEDALSPDERDGLYSIVSDNCVLDGLTGLHWEIKDEERGLHDWRNRYSWFNPREAHGELDFRGTANGGQCAGSDCDTWDYVRAVNDAELCGFSDWRVPSRDELYSISDLRKAANPPTASMDIFPYTQADEYWSSNDYSFQHDAAWAWSFRYGHDRVDWKSEAKFLRLARGSTNELTPVKE